MPDAPRTDTHAFRALIGGSPSSGSTLLSVLLDAHPDIMCGPELNLLAHPAFWEKGPEYVVDALYGGATDPVHKGVIPWARPATASLQYNLTTATELGAMAREISDPMDFLNFLFSQRGLVENARVSAEKSPPNVFAMDAALSRSSAIKCIVTLRDGRDVVRSLQKRRNPIPLNAARWVVKANLAYLLSNRYGADRLQVLRYEDLISDPTTELASIFRFLDVDPVQDHSAIQSKRIAHDPSISRSQGNVAKVWNHSVSDQITPGNVRTWDGTLLPRFLDYIYALKPKPGSLSDFGFEDGYLSGAELLAHFGYEDTILEHGPSRLTPQEMKVRPSAVADFYLPRVEDTRTLEPPVPKPPSNVSVFRSLTRKPRTVLRRLKKRFS